MSIPAWACARGEPEFPAGNAKAAARVLHRTALEIGEYNNDMRVNRRNSMRILAGAVAAPAALPLQVNAQRPPQAASDRDTQAARQDLKEEAQRIARVNLPRSTEPAFRFRA